MVAGDLLYVGSCSSTFYALDRRSGDIRWSYDTGQDGPQRSFHGDPLIVDDLVLITADNAWVTDGVGHVYAFDRTTGRLRWKHREEIGVSTNLARSGAMVYAVTLADELIALDLKTGELRWRFGSGAFAGRVERSAAPAATGNRVYMGALDGTVYALNATTGTVAWQCFIGARVSTALVMAGDDLYAGTAAGRLVRLDPRTGDVRGEIDLGELLFYIPAVTEGSVVVFAGTERLVCVERSLARICWERKTNERWNSKGPVVVGPLVLAGTAEGLVTALRLADGTPVWSRRVDGEVRSVNFIDGCVYVGTLGGVLYAWRADEAPESGATNTRPGLGETGPR